MKMFDIFSFFRKDKKVLSDEIKKIVLEPMQDTPQKRYQWIKGDQFGEMETVANSDSRYVYFESGKRIAVEAINEFMLELKNASEAIVLNPIDVPSVISQNSNMVSLPEASNNAKIETQSNGDIAIMETLNKHLSNSKFSKMLNLKQKINLPDQSIYDFLCEMYGDDKFNEILKRILMERMMEDMKSKLDDFINATYKNNKME